MTNANKQHAPYREKEDIYLEILTAVKEYESKNKKEKEGGGGIYITKLLFLSRLTSAQLNNHIQTLLENGLLIRDTTKGREVAASLSTNRRSKNRNRRGDTFHMTEKGLRYLNTAGEMRRTISGIRI